MKNKYIFRSVDCGRNEIFSMEDGDALLVNCWADKLIDGKLNEKVVIDIRINKNVIDEIIRQRIMQFLKI